ncbi:MAG: acyl-CoA dehydrogenase family protein [Chloroflexi bacterium]|nr:acyl-CoA dehydrogenase family protein [Chloroflexota bacterium]
MDFELSEEHKMLREAVRDFAQKEIAPLVEEAEAKEEMPPGLFPKLGKLGYICVGYPSEYGGGGMGMLGQCILIEEFCRVCVGIGSSVMTQGGIATHALLHHGTEAQKQKYLIPAIRGEVIGAYGLTEPNAGSDAAQIETTAVKQGDKYIINGNKIYITNTPICNYILVAAYTNKSAGVRGISVILVDRDTPGLTIKKMNKFCIRSSPTGEVTLDNCVVPAENLIGEEGKGFSYLMETLDSGRIVHAASSLSVAEAAYQAALDYGQQRVQFGHPIGTFQANSFKLARMAMEIEAARWLMYRAAWLYDQGERRFVESAMTKLYASEVAQRVTAEAMQIHGGVALMFESPVNRYFRDSRRSTITEGTSEIQLMVIARAIGIK